jgi:ElaA protein
MRASADAARTPGPAGARASAAPIAWVWAPFDGLSRDDLYDALQLRARVFILEQGPYLDPDGMDRQSWHLLGRLGASQAGLAAGELVLYLRVVAPGVKYPEPSIGRVVNHPALRGLGLGRALVDEGVRRCLGAFEGQGIRISAQAHLARFYGEFGFQPASEIYLEDNIPHQEMWRPA